MTKILLGHGSGGRLSHELISGQIMRALAMHDPQYSELSHDQVANRVTRYCFMGAVAKINGLSFFPRIGNNY